MSATRGKTSVEYRVPYADSDQMGVVYYANFFVYFERVRNEILRELGFPYVEMEARGYQLPVIEAHCNYRKAAKYDDLLVITGWPEATGPVRLKVHCEVRRGEELLAEGHTVHVCFSTHASKPVCLPPELL